MAYVATVRRRSWLRRSEIRSNFREGTYRFRCRRCKSEGLSHYSMITAFSDRQKHVCHG